MNEQAIGQLPQRQILALIALSGLPTPVGISFRDGGLLSLDFAGLADSEEWARHLNCHRPARTHAGRRWVDYDSIVWHGWRVLLHGSEPTADGGSLDHATSEALAVIATGGVT